MTQKLTALLLSLLIASPLPAQEPITTSIAAVGVGLKIVSMFSDASHARDQMNELETISRQIAEMKLQLNEMNQKLDSIIAALGELGVKMDTIAETEQRKRVDARIVTIATNYGDWSKESDPTDAKIAFQDLENESNNLMTRSSFANYQTVALGL